MAGGNASLDPATRRALPEAHEDSDGSPSLIGSPGRSRKSPHSSSRRWMRGFTLRRAALLAVSLTLGSPPSRAQIPLPCRQARRNRLRLSCAGGLTCCFLRAGLIRGATAQSPAAFVYSLNPTSAHSLGGALITLQGNALNGTSSRYSCSFTCGSRSVNSPSVVMCIPCPLPPPL